MKTWSKERPTRVDAGWRVLFAFASPTSRAAQAGTLNCIERL
jgi:hypothetical protein